MVFNVPFRSGVQIGIMERCSKWHYGTVFKVGLWNGVHSGIMELCSEWRYRGVFRVAIYGGANKETQILYRTIQL